MSRVCPCETGECGYSLYTCPYRLIECPYWCDWSAEQNEASNEEDDYD